MSDDESDEIADLRERVKAIEDTLEVLQTQTQYLSEGLDDQQTRVSKVDEEMQEMYDLLDKRVSAIENALDIDPKDALTGTPDPTQSELAQLSSLPDSIREDLSPSLRRAVIVWEHFDPDDDENPDWTTRVRRGRRITSGELKRYLSTALDKDLEYTQVHRVMESFDENTPSTYQIQKTNDGKALVHVG